MFGCEVAPARREPTIDLPITPCSTARHDFSWLARGGPSMIRRAPIGHAAREVAHAVRRDVPQEAAHRLGERLSFAAIAHLAERSVEVVAPREHAAIDAAARFFPLDLRRQSPMM